MIGSPQRTEAAKWQKRPRSLCTEVVRKTFARKMAAELSLEGG